MGNAFYEVLDTQLHKAKTYLYCKKSLSQPSYCSLEFLFL